MKQQAHLIFTSFMVLGGFIPYSAIVKAQGTIACSKMLKETPQNSLAYLKGDRSTLDSDCIEHALRNLGDDRYLPGTPILIQYLVVVQFESRHSAFTSFEQADDFFHAPYVVRDSGFDRWCGSKRQVLPAEIIGDHVERHGRDMILDLFREGVG